MLEQSFSLTELDHRLSNLIQFGKVCEADYQKAKLKVQIGEIVTDWLPWLTSRAGNNTSWWAPEVEEQVLVLAPSGEINQAVILPAMYQQQFPAPSENNYVHQVTYEDGTTLSYDKKHHTLSVTMTTSGEIKLTVGSSSFTINKDIIQIHSKNIDIKEID